MATRPFNRLSTGRNRVAMDALSPLGMVSDFPSENQTSSTRSAEGLFRREGRREVRRHSSAGGFVGCQQPHDPELIDRALRDAAEAAGATILHSHFHHFSPDGGVSGVLVLAESHISIHTWPERDFAAIDIFMCGACDPYHSLPALKDVFAPRSILLSRAAPRAYSVAETGPHGAHREPPRSSTERMNQALRARSAPNYFLGGFSVVLAVSSV